MGVDKATSVGFFWDVLFVLTFCCGTQFWQSYCQICMEKKPEPLEPPLVGVKNHGFLPFFSLSQLIEIFVG